MSSSFIGDARSAPDELALAQRLLNTKETGSGYRDLLDDPVTARAWLAETLAWWAEEVGSDVPEFELGNDEIARIRAVRKRVRAYVGGDRVGIRVQVTATIVSADDGTLRSEPSGAGVQWLESALWNGIFLAHELDTLKRLKLCRNEDCGWAFYDRSKNNSGVWHDVHSCGNLANLRASRARKRVLSEPRLESADGEG